MMTCLFKYPYSGCVEEVRTALSQSLLTIDIWDKCCTVEDLYMSVSKCNMLRGHGVGGSFNSSIPISTWKSLLHCLGYTPRTHKPSDTEYLKVLYIDSISSVKNSRISWYCRCTCGKITSILAKHLVSGHTKSCGCASATLRKTTTKKIYNVDVASKADVVKNKAKITLESKGMVPAEDLHKMNLLGLTCAQIATELGYSNASVVIGRLIRNGYTVIDHHIICDDVELLHDLNTKGGMSCSEIATKVGYAHASGVRNRLLAAEYIPMVYNNYISLPHKKISEFLTELGIVHENNNRSIIGKELDIYIPQHKLAIEIDGIYWHSEGQGKNSNYHVNKTDACTLKGIQLLHFWDFEIVNNSSLVRSMILAKCSLLSSRTFARKLTIKSISTVSARGFLKDNHLQGYANAFIKLALVDSEDKVQCVLTVGKARYTDAAWEVLRYANKLNTTVVGGFSRLLSYFRKTNKGSIVSYANRRFSNGSVYKVLGFTLVNTSKPCYYYFRNSDATLIHHRSKFMKHKLHAILDNFNPELSEVENMRANNYDRVFDCGTYVYKLENL